MLSEEKGLGQGQGWPLLFVCVGIVHLKFVSISCEIDRPGVF